MDRDVKKIPKAPPRKVWSESTEPTSDEEKELQRAQERAIAYKVELEQDFLSFHEESKIKLQRESRRGPRLKTSKRDPPMKIRDSLETFKKRKEKKKVTLQEPSSPMGQISSPLVERASPVRERPLEPLKQRESTLEENQSQKRSRRSISKRQSLALEKESRLKHLESSRQPVESEMPPFDSDMQPLESLKQSFEPAMQLESPVPPFESPRQRRESANQECSPSAMRRALPEQHSTTSQAEDGPEAPGSPMSLPAGQVRQKKKRRRTKSEREAVPRRAATTVSYFGQEQVQDLKDSVLRLRLKRHDDMMQKIALERQLRAEHQKSFDNDDKMWPSYIPSMDNASPLQLKAAFKPKLDEGDWREPMETRVDKKKHRMAEKSGKRMHQRMSKQDMMILLERNAAANKKKKDAKKKAKRGIVQHLRCSRKTIIDDIDLDDLSVYDELQYEMGLNKAKREPRDFIMDRNIEMLPAYTGMFRDGMRRVDYVVVMAAGGDDLYVDEMKCNFLSTLCKIGFDMEMERGCLTEFNNLLFVKIHCKDEIIADYMAHLDLYKKFRDSHLHFVGLQGVFRSYWDRYRPPHEREWLRIMRRRYFRPTRLSNRDRSYLAWNIIRHQPFGLRDRYYGFHRMLKYKIVLDGFALHDGPYFCGTTHDIQHVNARQILFYNWSSLRNFCRSQPLNIIQEYFGPKIGFHFAFYQFYLHMLLIMCVISILMLIPSYKQFRWIIEDRSSNFYCEGHKLDIKWLCPPCIVLKNCPFRNLTDYCLVHKFVRIAQKNMSMAPIFSTWCFLFWFFWVRKSNYWMWLWEVIAKPRHDLVRPEYTVKYRSAKRAKDTGMWKMRRTWTMYMIPFCNFYCGFFGVFAAVLIVYFSAYSHMQLVRPDGYLMRHVYRNRTRVRRFRDYVSFLYIVPLQFVLMSLFENFYHYMAPTWVKMENHRFYRNYERSYAYRIYATSVLFNTPFIAFYYWIKGRFYEHPLHGYMSRIIIHYGPIKFNITFPLMRDLLFMHCPKSINCIDEMVFILPFIMLLMAFKREWRTSINTFPRFLLWYTTDYTRGRDWSFNAPEWEREYQLKPLTENRVTSWTNHLVTEMTVFMWFGTTVPWMSIPMFIWNSFILRKNARQLVRSYRRPILANTRGLGPFQKIVCLVCLSAPIAHAFTNTRQHLYWKQPFDTRNFSIVKETLYRSTVPRFRRVIACHYITKHRFYNPIREKTLPWPFHWYNISSNRTKTVSSFNRYIVELSQVLDLIKYVHAFIMIILLFFIYFPNKSDQVAERSIKEQEIKRYAKHEEFILNDTTVGGLML